MTIMRDGELHKHKSHLIHDEKECTLRFHLKAPGAYTCSGCGLAGLDPCLKCRYENCDFHLHKTCFLADDITLQYPPFFDDCQFEYQESPPVRDHCGNVPYCDACGLDILGFRYRCNHPHNHHDLHPICASLKLKDKRVNEFGLIFQLQDNEKSKCLHCGKRYPVKECKRFMGWKWVCQVRETAFPFCFGGRKICYHLRCMHEIQRSKGEIRITKDPGVEYFSSGSKNLFTT